MGKRKPIIAGNWKINMNLDESVGLGDNTDHTYYINDFDNNNIKEKSSFGLGVSLNAIAKTYNDALVQDPEIKKFVLKFKDSTREFVLSINRNQYQLKIARNFVFWLLKIFKKKYILMD